MYTRLEEDDIKHMMTPLYTYALELKRNQRNCYNLKLLLELHI